MPKYPFHANFPAKYPYSRNYLGKYLYFETRFLKNRVSKHGYFPK